MCSYAYSNSKEPVMQAVADIKVLLFYKNLLLFLVS